MYNLPRGYLSSSACDLWENNPQNFREKYYLGRGGFHSPYTDFGKWFADDIEKHPDTYPNIPKYAVPEFPMKWVIEGVPTLGYLDSFCPFTKSILEYKTSIVKGAGSWTPVKVQKWQQLPFYAMTIKEMFGELNPVIKLVVMNTEWQEVCKETKFGTKIIRECSQRIGFAEGATDNPIIFERVIADWEIEAMKKRLICIATEVSNDYTSYQQSIA